MYATGRSDRSICCKAQSCSQRPVEQTGSKTLCSKTPQKPSQGPVKKTGSICSVTFLKCPTGLADRSDFQRNSSVGIRLVVQTGLTLFCIYLVQDTLPDRSARPVGPGPDSLFSLETLISRTCFNFASLQNILTLHLFANSCSNP